jgi:cell wall assembly regulator SMI1
MSSIWDRVERVLSVHAPPVHRSLRPPATEAQIAETETLLGLRFPEEIRAAYLHHDGQVAGNDWTYLPDRATLKEYCALFYWGLHWCNLDQLKALWCRSFNGKWKNRQKDREGFPKYNSSWDALAVRPILWSRKWIPIGISSGPPSGWIDLDPAPMGTEGQLISDDGTCEASVVALGFNHYLTSLLDGLESGEIVYSTKQGFICGRPRCVLHSISPTVIGITYMPVPPD